MIDHERDRATMIQVAAGNRTALGELYATYGSLMLALGERMLGNSREAEDVVHDVFVEVWQRAGQYDPTRGTVRTWIAMRMRSRCLDRLRSPERRRGTDLESAGAQAMVGHTELDPSIADHPRVLEALRELPEPQREVLVLGYFEGLSSSEIASRLSVPVGTVKSRVAAGLRKLRTALSVGEPTSAEAQRGSTS